MWLLMTQTATITVEASALQKLRQAVFHRYGQLYGNLKKEASSALRKHARNLGEGDDGRSP